VIGLLVVEHVINGKVLTKLVMQRFMPLAGISHASSFVNIHTKWAQHHS